MDVREFLKSIKALETRISTERELIIRLNALEESCTSHLTDMPRGSDYKDKTGITDKKMIKQDEVEPYIIKLKDKIIKGEEIIKLLPKDEQQTVFIQYYLLNNTWNNVCREVHMCYNKAQTLHKEGITYLNSLNLVI